MARTRISWEQLPRALKTYERGRARLKLCQINLEDNDASLRELYDTLKEHYEGSPKPLPEGILVSPDDDPFVVDKLMPAAEELSDATGSKVTLGVIKAVKDIPGFLYSMEKHFSEALEGYEHLVFIAGAVPAPIEVELPEEPSIEFGPHSGTYKITDIVDAAEVFIGEGPHRVGPPIPKVEAKCAECSKAFEATVHEAIMFTDAAAGLKREWIYICDECLKYISKETYIRRDMK